MVGEVASFRRRVGVGHYAPQLRLGSLGAIHTRAYALVTSSGRKSETATHTLQRRRRCAIETPCERSVTWGRCVCGIALRRRRYAPATPVLRLRRRSGILSPCIPLPTITHCVLHRGVSIAIRLRRIGCYHFRPCVFVRKYRGDVEPLRDRGVKKNNNQMDRPCSLERIR